MNYGTLYGLCGVAVMLLFYLIGSDIQSRIPSYLNYLLLIVFIYLGVKSYRDEELGGAITYGKSLGTGILIAMFGGIIIGVYTLVFFTYISPDMVDRIMEEAQRSMTEQGMSDEQIEMGLNMSRKFMTPMWMFFFSVLGSMLMGLIFSLIISIFLRKEQNPFSSNVG